jgi:hypothetical protein
VNAGPSLDLSKATKLKVVEFRCARSNVQWIATALQTIKSENLQQITINLFPASGRVGEAVRREWLNLDRLLTQFSTSRSIRPKIVYVEREGGADLKNLALSLFPELTRRGIIDVVEL